MNKDKNPYLTIALTNRCNFQCIYCSPDGNKGVGEGYGTKSQEQDLISLFDKIQLTEQLGIEKVRFTGGEPLLVPDIFNLLKLIDDELTIKYAVATNGSLITDKNIDNILSLDRLDLRISLDTLNRDKFSAITDISANTHDKLIETIKYLKSKNKLSRVACVVTKMNYKEIPEIIDFCEDYNLDLKLFDMYSTPKTKDNWKNIYCDFNSIKKHIDNISISKHQINYTKYYGIPALEYGTKKGIKIRIKDSNSGTRYNNLYCNTCDNKPCQEGLYTILLSSDRKLIPCRLSPIQYKADTIDSFKDNLSKLIKMFNNSYHENQFWS